jgi:hypothetical protein
MEVEMGQGRNLTDGEQKLCDEVFKWTIVDSWNIQVVRRPRTMHFGGFTPYARINMDGDSYLADYIGEDIRKPADPYAAHHFLHELAHSWQHLTGMAMMHLSRLSTKHGKAVRVADGKPMRPQGMKRKDWNKIKFNSIYSYDVNYAADLLDFTLEQQCEIIADYYALKLHWMTAAPAKAFGHPTPTLVQLEKVLGAFLADRNYPRYVNPHNLRRSNARTEMR